MKRIIKLTESDLTRIVKRILSEETNYFKVFDKEGDLVWTGESESGSEEERNLIDKLHDSGYKMKPMSQEEHNNFDFVENVIKHIKSKMKGLKRESYERGNSSWFYKNGKEALQYYNRFFIIDGYLYDELLNKFGLNERELDSIFSKFFDKRFPNLKHVGISYEYYN